MFRIRYLAGVSGLILLSGCSLNVSGLFEAPPPNGYAVGDNSYAVKTGTAILAQGGNAADAASAMFFTLAVLDPAEAGLGGGGICLVHNPDTDKTTEYAFLPQASGDGAYAIPTAPRGIARMQHENGRISWNKIISPAESYALTGFPMTESLHNALSANLDKIRPDATLAHVFLDENGHLLPVGSQLIAKDLGATLTQLRELGPQDLYTGAMAQAISGYSKISPQALAAYHSMKTKPGVMEINGNKVWLPSEKSGAGAYIRTLLSKTADTEKKSAFINALKQLKSGAAVSMGATGFAVVDGQGMSVTCTTTMNTPFGTAHTVTGTGVTLAPAKAEGTGYLSPVISASSSGSDADFVGAAAGGSAGNASLVATLIRVSHDEEIFDSKEIDSFGNHNGDLANVILCDDNDCVALPDPKGEGLGLSTEVPKL